VGECRKGGSRGGRGGRKVSRRKGAGVTMGVGVSKWGDF